MKPAVQRAGLLAALLPMPRHETPRDHEQVLVKVNGEILQRPTSTRQVQFLRQRQQQPSDDAQLQDADEITPQIIVAAWSTRCLS